MTFPQMESVPHLRVKKITLSLLKRSLLALALTSGEFLSCRTLDVEALGGALIRWSFISSDICLLLLLLAGAFSFPLDVHDLEVSDWQPKLRSLASTLIFDFILWSENGSWGKWFCFLTSRTCCRRWVSSAWSWLWLTDAETGNLCAVNWQCSCCDKSEQGGSKRYK